MSTYKNRTTIRFVIIGFLAGFLFPILGFLLECRSAHLPYTFASFLHIQQTQPLIWIIELAPLVLGFLAGMIGQQRGFLAVISRAKKEWETTFDAFSDPVFIIDAQGKIIRCNHAVLDRLNSTYQKVLGRQLTDVFSEGLGKNDGEVNFSESERLWFNRVYEVTFCPVTVEGMALNTVCILHDITERRQAEAEVEQSEILFRALFDRSPDAVILIDPHATDVSWPIIDCNVASCLMNGYSREELIGHSIDILNITSGTQAERSAYLAQLRDAGNLKIETQHRHKSGFVFPVDVSTSLITLRDRELVIGIDRDITGRKQAEAELQALFAAMTDVIIIYNAEGRYLKIAPTSQANLSRPSAEMLGKTVSDLFAPRQAAFFLEKINQALKTGELTRAEYSLTINGRDIWFSALISPMSADSVIWVARDVTEYKRNEREVAREKTYFETLVKNSPVAIVVMDNDERIISVNPAFESLFGYTSQEAVGAVLDTLIATPETKIEAARYSQEIMEGSIRGIVRRRRKDGTLVDVELSGVPIIVAGRKLSALVLYHDITELSKSRREAEEANRAKSEFLANMSHEIRTPMNGVMGMLELALDTKLTAEQTDYLQTSLHSAEALLSLLNDILDFSKIEAGRLELEAINFSLRNAVEDVAYTLARRAQEKGLEVACLVDPDLASSLRGDPGRLRQILVNLVGNAIKFTHQGEIVIRAEPRGETVNDVTVHFSVQDTGIGIPYERQAAVFERFTQADGTTTRTYGGTGLGLSISKQLVEMMGGRIGLDSTPGIGTTFWFDVRFEKVIPQKSGVTGPLIQGPANLTHARILVVDDNQTNRVVLVKNVEALGSRVDAVSSGAKGIESLRNAHRAGDPYHVVLLDMQMPGMDGEQTARAIKSDPSIKDVKILILTSMGQRGDASRLEALGCSGYLLKPVKQQMLFDAVLAVLGRTEDETVTLITRHTLSEKRKVGVRLLLAEDNPVNQKLAVILLQKAGYLVDAVETGAQAFEKVQTNPYSAVLMDVQMPEMDGFESTRLIRAWETQTGQHIPIIAMTAHAMSGDRERCIEAGMDDYVSKPLEPRVLFNAIDRCLQSADSKKESSLEPPEDFSPDAPIDLSADLGRDWLGDSVSSISLTTPKPDAASQAFPAVEDDLPADLEGALFRFGGDRDFMMEMCREFRGHLPVRIEEFNSALLNGDIKNLGRLGHNLKGVSLNFNAAPLAAVAAKLEICGKQENLADAPALVEQVEREIRRLQEYLDDQLK